jgi:hypothetical protein
MADAQYNLTHGDIASLWNAIAKARKAKGDHTGALTAQRSAYTTRLGWAARSTENGSVEARTKRVSAVKPANKALAAHIAAAEAAANVRVNAAAPAAVALATAA